MDAGAVGAVDRLALTFLFTLNSLLGSTEVFS